MADVEDPYNHSHRAFLQAFLAHSILTFEELKPILAAILSVHDDREVLPNDITEPDVSTYLHTLNSKLAPVDYEIRPARSQKDHSTSYVLVNLTSDAVTQLATTHSPDEIAFVKRVLDAMFETHNTRNHEVMAITRMQARHLSKAPRTSIANEDGGTQTQSVAAQGLTLPQAEKMLDDMVEEGWFENSAAGYYSLSARALAELRDWLRETYNEMPGEGDEDETVIRIRNCEACTEIVTIGQRCSNHACACRLHDICTQRLFRSQAANARRCPKCKEEWTGKDFVGEKAAKRNGGSRQHGSTASSRQVTQNGARRDSSEDDGE
ncbi:putative DNA repair protein Nse1 [Lophium mytilinum]|uniref:Non-structural maintenance of chromosomes element 1 homolog n=1 Tax=Lophium mytilinum TaxID=390894 RepID=A0A6A6R789_9PEZI|nr:putative DNA repair protein Nse1 [Lophium mytilinum]